MYCKRVIHKNVVDNNAYISAGDPYIGGLPDKIAWWELVRSEHLKPIKCQVSAYTEVASRLFSILTIIDIKASPNSIFTRLFT